MIDLAERLAALRAMEEAPPIHRIAEGCLPPARAWIWDSRIGDWWEWSNDEDYEYWLEPQNATQTHWCASEQIPTASPSPLQPPPLP